MLEIPFSASLSCRPYPWLDGRKEPAANRARRGRSVRSDLPHGSVSSGDVAPEATPQRPRIRPNARRNNVGVPAIGYDGSLLARICIGYLSNLRFPKKRLKSAPMGRQITYQEAITYLYSLTDYVKTRVERHTPATFDLSRVERLLAAMGNPHRRFPMLHIAGTKGKGSTAAMLESCLRTAGYRTGLYTSPHLHTFCERIQVNGRKIAQAEIVAMVEELRPSIECITGVTTFEAITAIAFLYFARADIDVGVIEVGLGGRLDPTNVIIPDVSIITSLSLDHTQLLGNTLAQIACEKAGIIKPEVPVVSAPQRAEAMSVLEKVSRERGSVLIQVGRDWNYDSGPADLDGQSFTVRRIIKGSAELAGEYWMPLLGRYQLENGTAAIAALEVIRERGFCIPARAVREGMCTVKWPGRLEILGREPPVVVDCAHNPYSTQMLCQALEEWFPGRRWVLVFGASTDKDIPGMLQKLLPMSEYVIVTRSEHPRAAAPIELADAVASAGGRAEVSANVSEALRRALIVSRPDSGLLVTGSIFIVANAREEWARHVGAALPDKDG